MHVQSINDINDLSLDPGLGVMGQGQYLVYLKIIRYMLCVGVLKKERNKETNYVALYVGVLKKERKKQRNKETNLVKNNKASGTGLIKLYGQIKHPQSKNKGRKCFKFISRAFLDKKGLNFWSFVF